MNSGNMLLLKGITVRLDGSLGDARFSDESTTTTRRHVEWQQCPFARLSTDGERLDP